MTVDKRQTARARRQRQSAEDQRVVAKTVGSVGIGILCVVFGIVMLMDLPRFIHWCRCKKKKKNLRGIELKTKKWVVLGRE